MHSSEPTGEFFGKVDTTVGCVHVPTFFPFWSVGWGFVRSGSLLLCVGEHTPSYLLYLETVVPVLKMAPVNAALTAAGAYLEIRAPVGPQCHVFCFCKVSDSGSVAVFQVSYSGNEGEP